MLFKDPDLKEGVVFCLTEWSGGPSKDGELEVPDEHAEAFVAQFPQFRAPVEQKAEPKKLAEQGDGK